VNPITAPIGSDLYSLDVSVAFNIFSVPWAQLTPGPYASFHSVGLLGSGNSLLAIYGGNTSFASTPSSSPNSLHLYNTATGSWTPSPLQDPPRRSQQTAVSRLGDGTMFVFGGLALSADLQQGSSTSELWTLGGYIDPNSNTTGSTSSNSSSSTVTPSAPVPPGLSPGTVGWQKMPSPQGGTATDRSFHTATLLRSNGLLVIIGGVSGGSLASMSEILVYDTGAGTWSVQTATGATPPLRRNHAAAASMAILSQAFCLFVCPHGFRRTHAILVPHTQLALVKFIFTEEQTSAALTSSLMWPFLVSSKTTKKKHILDQWF